ncbi:hypothetical protein HQ520_16875, partial [bacterium]|nr:hypothetical protein [bacterium]
MNPPTEASGPVVERILDQPEPMRRVQAMYERLKTITDGRSLIPAIANHIDIQDLGAVGDGKTDDGPAFVRAMDMAMKAGGNCVIRLERNKVYRILSASNVSPDGSYIDASEGKNGAHLINLRSVANVIFDGRGSTLVLTWPVEFISVQDSRNVWIGNLIQTYDPFPCAQTRLVAQHRDIGAIDVQLEPGFDLPAFDPPDSEDHGKWAFSWGIDPNAHLWTKFIREIDDASTEKGIFRILLQDNARGKVGALKNGQRILVPTLKNGARVSGTHSSIAGSDNVILYGITSHAANQFSYHISSNKGPVIVKRCQIRPRALPDCPTEQVFA